MKVTVPESNILIAKHWYSTTAALYWNRWLFGVILIVILICFSDII